MNNTSNQPVKIKVEEVKKVENVEVKKEENVEIKNEPVKVKQENENTEDSKTENNSQQKDVKVENEDSKVDVTSSPGYVSIKIKIFVII